MFRGSEPKGEWIHGHTSSHYETKRGSHTNTKVIVDELYWLIGLVCIFEHSLLYIAYFLSLIHKVIIYLILFLRNLFLFPSRKVTGSVQRGRGLSCCTCIQSPAPNLSGNSLSLPLALSDDVCLWPFTRDISIWKEESVGNFTLLYFPAITQRKPKPLTKRYTSPKPRGFVSHGNDIISGHMFMHLVDLWPLGFLLLLYPLVVFDSFAPPFSSVKIVSLCICLDPLGFTYSFVFFYL